MEMSVFIDVYGNSCVSMGVYGVYGRIWGTFYFNQSIGLQLFAIFMATDEFRGKKIEYPSKQFNLRHPLRG